MATNIEEAACKTRQTNLLECRVCEDVFQLHGDKVPRLLLCGHTVCHDCLTRLPTHGRTLQCPFDRQATELSDSGVWGLKKNFALIELLEKLQVSSGPLKSSEEEKLDGRARCDENEEHKASVYCTVCGTDLCLACSENIHATKTLTKHRRIPLSEKPREKPKCPLHSTHVIEFTCLEESCRESSLMCFVCKDYGRHQNHKHALLETEAENMRSSVTNAIQHVRTFTTEVTEASKKLTSVIDSIEGGEVLQEDDQGTIMQHHMQGTAEDARFRVRSFFDDLRETVNRQEEAGLAVVDNYVREKLFSLRQQQEDMAVLISQVNSVCLECEKSLQRTDAEVIQARNNIHSLLETVQEQQQQFIDMAQLCNTDAGIPVAFTKDNRVHIGPKMEMRAVALGLDGAGKTSILFKLKQDEFVSPITTIGFNVETIEHKSLKFTIWDVGGLQKLRPLWRHYYLNTQAIIFVIDSSNVERLSEAQDELSKLMAEKRLRDALLLILANKQDLPAALSVESLTERLSLHKLCCGRSWNIVACDAHSLSGLHEGLDWLARQLMAEFAL
ncbi:E3 ubiquitin-protein ligase TRIM23 [Exaiptasia diaphana]|uniref:RING-type E3 ubiquitin transferase n=1 Tax=Exaiptasia diaphana TaxID=2652724 RepID=A0A913WVN9_EXADI|nr:E3 ubiquitin-protein ligase TRIM23 [Exaiptasia diaphana]KXJ17535.1 E3 ubiquitin-protein ligase TRIM23 [Exaiptasia diaphana]